MLFVPLVVRFRAESCLPSKHTHTQREARLLNHLRLLLYSTWKQLNDIGEAKLYDQIGKTAHKENTHLNVCVCTYSICERGPPCRLFLRHFAAVVYVNNNMWYNNCKVGNQDWNPVSADSGIIINERNAKSTMIWQRMRRVTVCQWLKSKTRRGLEED